MTLAGGTGNRPTALLQLRFLDISVALLPDLEGSEWPRVVIDWMVLDGLLGLHIGLLVRSFVDDLQWPHMTYQCRVE